MGVGRSLDPRTSRTLRYLGWLIGGVSLIGVIWWMTDRLGRLDAADSNRWSSAVIGIVAVGSAALVTLIASEVVHELGSRRRLKARDRHEGLEEMRDDVLAAVAHNLRGPALAVRTQANVLRDGRLHLSAAERNAMIEELADTTEDLTATLEDAYVEVAASVDRLSVAPGTVELRSLMETAVGKVGRRRLHSLSIRGAATAHIDPVYGAQVLRTMVRIPGVLAASTIEVEIAVTGARAEVIVTDDASRWPTDLHTAVTQATIGSSDYGSLARSAGIAAALARAMGGHLEHDRLGSTNVLRFIAPAAVPAMRTADLLDSAAWLNDERLTVADIQMAIEEGPERIAFQPIVELANPSVVVGHEALSRFGAGSPTRWFSVAERAGLQVDLERACIETALLAARGLSDGFIAINLSSALLTSAGLVDSLDGIDPARVVIELSESSQIDRYETAADAIAMLTGAGFRLALDDVGNSEIDLWRIVRLRPAIVKLDLSLARGIDQDADRRAVAGAMIAVAHAIDADVVAEGIETSEECETLHALGADLGQGFLFDRQVASRVAAEAGRPGDADSR